MHNEQLGYVITDHPPVCVEYLSVKRKVHKDVHIEFMALVRVEKKVKGDYEPREDGVVHYKCYTRHTMSAAILQIPWGYIPNTCMSIKQQCMLALSFNFV